MELLRNVIPTAGKELLCAMHKRKTSGGSEDKNVNVSYSFHVVGETGLTDMKQPEDNVKPHIIK